MTLLVLRSSPMGDFSVSNHAVKAFEQAYKAEFPDDKIVHRDLFNGLPDFTAKRVQAKFALYGGPDKADGIEEYKIISELIEELKSSDKIVIGAPMWNFFIPDSLKLWIDHVVQPNKTFDPATYAGLVTGKPVLIIRAAGGAAAGTANDYGLAYLVAALKFIGFTDIRQLSFNGTSNQAAREELLKDVSEKATAAAQGFGFNADAAPAPLPALGASAQASPKPGAPAALGKNVLHVTASPLGDNSATRSAAAAFLDEYKSAVSDAQVTTLDLAAVIESNQFTPYSALRVQGKFAKFAAADAPLADDIAAEWSDVEARIAEFQAADTVVLSVPMWNLGIPYSISRYFHYIVQPNYTFDGKTWGGLVSPSKKVFIISASGGGLLGGAMDHVTPYLKQILGFIGVTDVTVVHVNGTSGAGRQAAIDSAVADLKSHIAH